MIKQYIFDIGNVLVDFHPHRYFEQVMPNQQMAKVCDLVFDEVWEEIDRGTYLQDHAMKLHLKRYPQYEKQIRYIYAHWLEMMALKEDTFAFLQSIQEQGFPVYLLSNIGEESHAYLKLKYSFFEAVDGMVLSYQERCNKPNRKIYEILLERYQLKAEECVFFDDSKANVAMAQELGIHAYVFECVEQVQKEMEVGC